MKEWEYKRAEESTMEFNVCTDVPLSLLHVSSRGARLREFGLLAHCRYPFCTFGGTVPVTIQCEEP